VIRSEKVIMRQTLTHVSCFAEEGQDFGKYQVRIRRKVSFHEEFRTYFLLLSAAPLNYQVGSKKVSKLSLGGPRLHPKKVPIKGLRRNNSDQGNSSITFFS